MPSAWLISLKRSMNCRDSSDPKQPEDNDDGSDTSNSCLCSSGCSKSLSNLRDVIHGSKRHTSKAPTASPGSIRSSEILNPITHRAVFADSKCVLEIKTRCSDDNNGKRGSTFVGTLRPGTPGPGDRFVEPVLGGRMSKGGSILGSGCGVDSKPRRSLDLEYHGYVCHKCGEKFKKLEAIEAHHLSMHAVTKLSEEDCSKKIVELICQIGFRESENNFHQIEKILKVHNTQRTLAQFEDYREMVKLKAHKVLSKKHPRCLADGNELLRFHGTTVACSLGTTESTSSLCTSEKCGVCQILRYGFLSKKEPNGCWGVFTCSTSKRAMERVGLDEASRCVKKALMVCRVIAGRVLKPLEKLKEKEDESSFDSMAGEADCHSSIDELYSLNPKAILPCFVVVICKD